MPTPSKPFVHWLLKFPASAPSTAANWKMLASWNTSPRSWSASTSATKATPESASPACRPSRTKCSAGGTPALHLVRLGRQAGDAESGVALEAEVAADQDRGHGFAGVSVF